MRGIQSFVESSDYTVCSQLAFSSRYRQAQRCQFLRHSPAVAGKLLYQYFKIGCFFDPLSMLFPYPHKIGLSGTYRETLTQAVLLVRY